MRKFLIASTMLTGLFVASAQATPVTTTAVTTGGIINGQTGIDAVSRVQGQIQAVYTNINTSVTNVNTAFGTTITQLTDTGWQREWATLLYYIDNRVSTGTGVDSLTLGVGTGTGTSGNVVLGTITGGTDMSYTVPGFSDAQIEGQINTLVLQINTDLPPKATELITAVQAEITAFNTSWVGRALTVSERTQADAERANIINTYNDIKVSLENAMNFGYHLRNALDNDAWDTLTVGATLHGDLDVTQLVDHIADTSNRIQVGANYYNSYLDYVLGNVGAAPGIQVITFTGFSGGTTSYTANLPDHWVPRTTVARNNLGSSNLAIDVDGTETIYVNRDNTGIGGWFISATGSIGDWDGTVLDHLGANYATLQDAIDAAIAEIGD